MAKRQGWIGIGVKSVACELSLNELMMLADEASPILPDGDPADVAWQLWRCGIFGR